MSKIKVNEISTLTGSDITITTGKTLTGTASQFKITGGTAGQALITDGSGTLTFSDAGASVTIADDPPSSPSTGDLWWESDTGILKVYYNDGTTSQWVDATPQDAPIDIPSQSTHAGKYLQTDGTTATWEPVDSLPTQTGNENKFLTTDGTTEEWGPNTGKGYNNWNNVAVNVTTTVPADENAVVFGPITVTSPAVWTVNGPGILRVL